MTATEEDLTGQVLGGKYRLDRRLGVGGFGSVYEATHVLGRATRAVKVINRDRIEDPVACRLFLKEAQAVMRLESPRTVVVHDVDRDESGRLFIVMELLKGETLREYLKRSALPGRGLPVPEAERITREVCEALHEAHSKGVVHRDLKPSNVMMVPGGDGTPHVKVVDFGIARLYSLSQTGETSTEILIGAVGTPPYMSPEQCRGQDVDARSDLYSLGVMLYEMLAGRLPFRSNTSQGYAMAHLVETPIPLATACPQARVSPDLDALVMRLLAKKPGERPASAAEVLRALDRRGEPRETETPPPPARSWRRPLGVIGAAGFAALVAVAAWIAWPDGAPEAPQHPVESATPPAAEVTPIRPSAEPARALATPDARVVPDPGPSAPAPRTIPTGPMPRLKSARRPERPPVKTVPAAATRPPAATREPTPAAATPAATPSPTPSVAPAHPAKTSHDEPAPRRTPRAPAGSPDPWDAEFDELDRSTR